MVGPVYVNKVKTEDDNGREVSKAGVYFLLVTGQSASDPWEVTLSTG